MEKSTQTGSRVMVAMTKEYAIVRVFGRGSFNISVSLKEFGDVAIERGHHTLIFDLQHCIGMDSTFMGMVAGLAYRARRAAEGGVIMINLSEKTRNLLTTLGLDSIVGTYMLGEEPEPISNLVQRVDSLRDLEPQEDRLKTTETMLEAHQTLTKVDSENVTRFKDVLLFLSEDLDRQRQQQS